VTGGLGAGGGRCHDRPDTHPSRWRWTRCSAAVLRGSPGYQCPPGADEATGFSPNVLVRVQVVEIGGLFGGIAGFNDLFVRVCRTSDLTATA
jgi:hypothetical protein